MKQLVVFLGLLVLAYADPFDNIDWSTIKTRDLVIQPNGKARVQQRIVGGQPADPNQFPYQGGLIVTTPTQNYFCGCALISQNYVLTAAHCLDDATQVQVRLGAHLINEYEVTQQRFTSTELLQHPEWNIETLAYDFGLVRLPTPATITPYVQIVALPTWSQVDTTFTGDLAYLTGWGITSDLGTAISESLNYLQSTIISNLACNIGYLGVILPTHICTSGDGYTGACTGDSGGAVVNTNGTLVGVMSFALSYSCEAGWPSGHARVTTALPWLSEVSDAAINP
ncbi:chymotrypsin-related [Holotrichia oblita]|uniref:Chymotrypsin-related n=2 Tax=Holotrichia oblita TaxID=644536 RepID=A0ACB9TQ30_HOLOL|nr:chymotrypsin-related [Holotrichia oblita]KAI4468872.1 chymotrypsin-related [Holotrichia oblita]